MEKEEDRTPAEWFAAGLFFTLGAAAALVAVGLALRFAEELGLLVLW
ncbi:MAG: hypothetical protein ACYC5A_02615 [Thermoleophilia bacterium]